MELGKIGLDNMANAADDETKTIEKGHCIGYGDEPLGS